MKQDKEIAMIVNVKFNRRWSKFIFTFIIIFVITQSLTYSQFYLWTEQINSGNDKNWQVIASSSDGSKVAAVVNSGYIYTSTDYGVTWSQKTNSGYRFWYSLASSSDGTKLAAGVTAGYIYTSTDGGGTWTQQTSSGSRHWYSIASSSDGTKLAATNSNGYIYTSTDGGGTWTQQTSSGSRHWYSIASSSDGTKLAACGLDTYIYTSIDGGLSWTQRVNSGSRKWRSITSSSDGTKLAAGADNAYIYTSTDSGVNWVQQTNSGIKTSGPSMSSSSDGTKLAASPYGDYVYTSTDSGVNWTQQTNSSSKNWQSITSSSDGSRLLVCGNQYNIYTASFTIPTLATNSITNLSTTTATCGGNVTSDGGATVTTRGVCWNTSSGVTTANTKTTENGSFGTGSFSASYTGLSPNTLYYTAAYGTNTAGTGYGDEKTFTTLPGIPTYTGFSSITSSGFRFSWSAPSPAGNQTYTYNVQISANSNFSSPVVDVTGLTSGTLFRDASSLTQGTLYYCRVSATNSTGTGSWAETSTHTIASTVYLSAGYDATHTPDNNYWNIRYFNDLATAISNSTTGSTIIVKSYNGTSNTSVSSINTDNNIFEIDNGDFTVTTINGSGLIKAISTGYLIQSPSQNNAKIYPLTDDGTNDLTISITCLNAPTNPIKVKLIHKSSGESDIMTYFWDIQGDNNLNATLKFNISKTAITGDVGLIRFWNGSRYIPIPQDRTTIEDKGTYFQVTITGINQFDIQG
jgi:hypothetical protein